MLSPVPAFKPDPELDRELGRRIQASKKAGALDEEARNELVVRHLRGATRVALNGRSWDDDDANDLLQESILPMLRAAADWDPECGVPFLNYASQRIRARRDELFATMGRVVRMPKFIGISTAMRTLIERIEGAGESLPATLDEAGLAALAARHGVELAAGSDTPRMLLLNVAARQGFGVSVGLDAPRDDRYTLAETIADDCEGYDDERDEARELLEATLVAMEKDGGTSERRAQVLRMLAQDAQDDSNSLKAVAQALGVVRERARQIRNEAIREVKARIAGEWVAPVVPAPKSTPAPKPKHERKPKSAAKPKRGTPKMGRPQKRLVPREDGRVFYAGQWLTLEKVERYRAHTRARDARKKAARVGGQYSPNAGDA